MTRYIRRGCIYGRFSSHARVRLGIRAASTCTWEKWWKFASGIARSVRFRAEMGSAEIGVLDFLGYLLSG